MARFVPDSKTGRWVIIAPTRISRPHDNSTTPDEEKKTCPFCPGQESLNKTLYENGGVRVIANKYPITDLHEVIIHSPDHTKDIDALSLAQVELILSTYRARFNFHKDNGQVLIFNNHDAHAGASIKHPHSQLVVVPKQVNLDVIMREPEKNVVTKTNFFTVYCPDFSQWPNEVWITLSDNTTDNFGTITDEQIEDLAAMLQKILKHIVGKFSGPDTPYNFYIYHGNDWYLRIIPRLVHRAGFELGTGLSVNIVDPADAAKDYGTALE